MDQKKYRLWLAARLFIGLIFVVAGFFKLTDPIENFRGMITAYGVIPYVLVTPVSLVLPWVELIFGIFLIAGYLPRISAAVLGLLSLSFVILIAAAKIAGTLPDSCGCFGEHLPMSPYQMAALDMVNFLLSIRLILIKQHHFSLAG